MKGSCRGLGARANSCKLASQRSQRAGEPSGDNRFLLRREKLGPGAGNRKPSGLNHQAGGELGLRKGWIQHLSCATRHPCSSIFAFSLASHVIAASVWATCFLFPIDWKTWALPVLEVEVGSSLPPKGGGLEWMVEGHTWCPLLPGCRNCLAQMRSRGLSRTWV